MDGDATDHSGNTNNGTLNNFTFDGTTNGWSGGRFGQALQFNGTNDYVNIPASSTYAATTAVTESAWIKSSATNGWIIDGGGGWGVSGYDLAEYSGKTRFELQDSTRSAKSYLDASPPPSDGNWHMVTATWSSSDSTMRIYTDGVVSVTTVSFTGPIGPMSAPTVRTTLACPFILRHKVPVNWREIEADQVFPRGNRAISATR